MKDLFQDKIPLMRCLQRGFSLTELSISIAIIALLIGAALSVVISSDYNAKKTQTEGKLDRIESALAAYLKLNERLPCPADGALTADDLGYGEELTPSAASCAPAVTTLTAGNIYAGTLPTKTLQLPDDFMLDGWSRRFTYVVDYRFANNDTTNVDCDGGVTSTICFIDTPAGEINVIDGNASDRTTEAVYVVISHGANGHGAFTKNGSAILVNAYSVELGSKYSFEDERDNSHLNEDGSNFTPYDAVFVQKELLEEEGGEYFDDLVRFRTKSQIVNLADALFFDSSCRQSADIINNPGSNICIGADDETSCTQFASEIYDRCI